MLFDLLVQFLELQLVLGFLFQELHIVAFLFFSEVFGHFKVKLSDHECKLDLNHFPDKIDDISPKAIRRIAFEHLGLPILQRCVNVANKLTQIVILDKCLVLHLCAQ